MNYMIDEIYERPLCRNIYNQHMFIKFRYNFTFNNIFSAYATTVFFSLSFIHAIFYSLITTMYEWNVDFHVNFTNTLTEILCMKLK